MSDLPELARFLPWDSEFFGKRIARVLPKSLNRADLDLIDGWSRENHIDCLYFLSESVGGAELTAVQNSGFRLMDLRVTFIQELSRVSKFSSEDISSIALANEGDIPELQKIAAINHRDSRFYSDNHFDRDLSDAMYAIWIEKAVLDPKQTVLIYRQADKPLGYASYVINKNKEAEIGLVGVSPDHRGKGIGLLLIKSLLNRLKSEQSSKVSVVTQGKNIGALNLYEKAGFRILKIESWFHKWY